MCFRSQNCEGHAVKKSPKLTHPERPQFLGGLLPTLFVLSAAIPSSPAQAVSLNPITTIKCALEAAVEDRGVDNIGVNLKLKATAVAKNIEIGKSVKDLTIVRAKA